MHKGPTFVAVSLDRNSRSCASIDWCSIRASLKFARRVWISSKTEVRYTILRYFYSTDHINGFPPRNPTKSGLILISGLSSM